MVWSQSEEKELGFGELPKPKLFFLRSEGYLYHFFFLLLKYTNIIPHMMTTHEI